MPNYAEGNSPLERYLSREKTNQDRDDAAEKIGERREELWQSLIVRPVTAFVPRWIDAWERFRTALHGTSSSATNGALDDLGRLLCELHGLRRDWDEAIEKWFAECATPWNKQYGDLFTDLDRSNKPHWLRNWALRRYKPAELPGEVSRWVESYVPKHLYDHPEFRASVPILYLFGELNGAGGQASMADHLRDFAARDELAAVVLILAAIILPAPDILIRFFDASPRESVLDLASGILHLSTGIIGDGLRDEFRVIRAERKPKPLVRTAEPAHRPAAARADEREPPADPEERKGDAAGPRAAGRGGRRKLVQKAKVSAQEKAKLNAYQLVREALQPGWGAQSLLSHFTGDKDFKELVKSAGRKYDEAFMRAALKWIADNNKT